MSATPFKFDADIAVIKTEKPDSAELADRITNLGNAVAERIKDEKKRGRDVSIIDLDSFTDAAKHWDMVRMHVITALKESFQDNVKSASAVDPDWLRETTDWKPVGKGCSARWVRLEFIKT